MSPTAEDQEPDEESDEDNTSTGSPKSEEEESSSEPHVDYSLYLDIYSPIFLDLEIFITLPLFSKNLFCLKFVSPVFKHLSGSVLDLLV